MSFGIWQRTITDETGNVLPGASIEVRAPSASFTGALVSLFSNEAGSTGLSNPFTADNEGFAQFYAAPRKVDIRATGSGSQRTWRNVEILGTAATADKQTSPTDTTAGRLIPTEYGYYKGNILGTVSQSGGEVTGAIIERGSNSNGEYVKFADGTLFCTDQQTPVSEIQISIGANLFRMAHTNNTFRFASTFSSSPTVTMALQNQSSDFTHWIGDVRGNSTTSIQYELYGTTSTLPTGLTTHCTAIGRWY